MSGNEALNSAIYNEKLASDHYRKISEAMRNADNGSVADFFLEQSKRETGHYNSLFKFKENNAAYQSGGVGEVVKWITDETYAATHSPANIDMDTALQAVEAAEISAEAFYRKAASETEDKKLAGLFSKLAEEEAHHLYLAKKIRVIFEQKGVIEPTDYDDLGVG